MPLSYSFYSLQMKVPKERWTQIFGASPLNEEVESRAKLHFLSLTALSPTKLTHYLVKEQILPTLYPQEKRLLSHWDPLRCPFHFWDYAQTTLFTSFCFIPTEIYSSFSYVNINQSNYPQLGSREHILCIPTCITSTGTWNLWAPLSMNSDSHTPLWLFLFLQNRHKWSVLKRGILIYSPTNCLVYSKYPVIGSYRNLTKMCLINSKFKVISK